ncbi:MAG TPA: hypothetical protein VFT06_16035 [Flavisolibacter sp.]|nr:hypothetical protein [Flavisolibacter sp.]
MTNHVLHITIKEAAERRPLVYLEKESSANGYLTGPAVFVCTKKDGDYRYNAACTIVLVRTAEAAATVAQPVFKKSEAGKKMNTELPQQYRPWGNETNAFFGRQQKEGEGAAFGLQTTVSDNKNETVL